MMIINARVFFFNQPEPNDECVFDFKIKDTDKPLTAAKEYLDELYQGLSVDEVTFDSGWDGPDHIDNEALIAVTTTVADYKHLESYKVANEFHKFFSIPPSEPINDASFDELAKAYPTLPENMYVWGSVGEPFGPYFNERSKRGLFEIDKTLNGTMLVGGSQLDFRHIRPSYAIIRVYEGQVCSFDDYAFYGFRNGSIDYKNFAVDGHAFKRDEWINKLLRIGYITENQAMVLKLKFDR